jgi:hypothetical protein
MSREITLHDAAQAYLEHLKKTGKSEATVYTYGKDFELIEGHFGAERKLTAILPAHIGKFFKSDALLKKPSGADRAKPTIDKTKRVFRMFFFWAKEQGHIENLPLPKDTPLGRSAKKAEAQVGADAEA